MSENTMNNLKIGVDVGGTKIEAVLVDAMGTVLGSARIPARHGNDAVIEDIVAVAHQAAGERRPMWKTTSMPPPSARPPCWAVQMAWPVPLRS